jgi:CheY-like chemotaxis protein
MGALVLVVDDERAFLRMVVASVQLLGYQAVGVESGEDALELVAEHKPDVVLSDVRLPGMDGVELTNALKNHEPLAATPVLLMSAYRDPGARLASGFLQKPFDIDDLDSQLRRVLGR